MKYCVDLAFLASQFVAEITKPSGLINSVFSEVESYMLCEAFIKDKQSHNHIALTYKINCKDNIYYLRFSVSLKNSTWFVPSSLYFYTDIHSNVGYKISFKDINTKFFRDNYYFFDLEYNSILDVMNAYDVLLNQLLSDFSYYIVNTSPADIG